MAVGRVRGGKGSQGTSGPTGSSGASSSDKAGSTSGVSAAFSGRLGGSQAATGASGASAAQGTGEVVGSGVKVVDPLSTRAQALAQEFKLGKISKDEARKLLFADAAAYATRKKMRINNRKLEEAVRNKANSDPNLIRLVDQILSKG